MPNEPARFRFIQFIYLIANLKTGLRAMFFLRVAPDEKDINWTQLVLLTLFGLAIQFAWDFSRVGLHGAFSFYGLPGALYGLPIMLLASWILAQFARQPEATLKLLVVFSAISLPFYALSPLGVSLVDLGQDGFLIRYIGNHVSTILICWLAVACGIAAHRLLFSGSTLRVRFLVLPLALLYIALPLSQYGRYQTLWTKPYDPNAYSAWKKNHQPLDFEDNFYLQQKLLDHELAAIQPSRPDGPNLFFVGVAGYSEQDVFMKEIHYVAKMFGERFGTAGHSVMLINNPKTVTKSPIASATSLGLALKQVGAMMDQNKDILFLYMTSHGSQDFKFSLNFGSMQFKDLDPRRLRQLLDDSGIKRRVIVIAACYSGGFIDALKNDDTLVITAAAPDKTSFGCSNEEDFTYFGRAYFADALQKTDSFIEAFDLAKPAITAREQEEDFTPSDPRIFVGSAIKAPLAEFSRKLMAARVSGTLASYQQSVAHDEPPIAAPVSTARSESAPADDRPRMAGDLVKALQYDTMLQDSIKNCKEMGRARKPEDLLKTNPNVFKGITPQSPLWPKVVEAYYGYFEATCNYMESDDYLVALTQVYSSSLAPDTLKESTEFYSSPAGKKLVAAHLAANIVLQKETWKHSAATSEKADAEYNKKIAELAGIAQQTRARRRVAEKPWWQFWDGGDQ